MTDTKYVYVHAKTKKRMKDMADNWLRGEYVCFPVHTLLNGGSARKRISRVYLECDSHLLVSVILTLDKQLLGGVLKVCSFWEI